jgi:hypothetical protein
MPQICARMRKTKPNLMEHREWTQEEIMSCINGEKLALKGDVEDNQAFTFMATQMIDSLKRKPDLFVVAYRHQGDDYNDYSQWEEVGIMNFDDYYKMLNEDTLKNSRMYACHPVNFNTLKEFDAIAL